MFWKKKTTLTGSAPSDQKKQAIPSTQEGGDALSFSIHTIPTKFLPQERRSTYTLRRHITVGLIIVVVVALVLGTAAWLLVTTIKKNESEKLFDRDQLQRDIGGTDTPQAIENPGLLEEKTVLLDKDFSDCTYSPIESGKPQQSSLGKYAVQSYAANYFCTSGSISVIVYEFELPEELDAYIPESGLEVGVFRDGVQQLATDASQLLWGSGKILVRMTLQSIEPDALGAALLIDGYRLAFLPDTTLPWKQPEPPVVLKTPMERDERRLADIKKIQVALEFYRIDTGKYPPILDPVTLPVLGQYLPELPTDPEGKQYVYTVLKDGAEYAVSFHFEEGSGGYESGEYEASSKGIQRPGKSTELEFTILPPTQDTDSDQMTDAEELVWGTSEAVADSDGDGFGDGQELINLFDPTAAGGKRLENSNRVRTYLSSTYSFAVVYPTAWAVEDRGETGVRFVPADREEFFEIIVDTPSRPFGSVAEWYASEFAFAPDVPQKIVTLPGNIQAMYSPDRLSIYVLVDQRLYILNYSPGVQTGLRYPTTFEMFIRSFHFFENPNT